MHSCAIAVIFLALMSITPAPAHADNNIRQHKIEAAFLYHFFNYITWPGYTAPENLQQATICIYGDDAVAPYLAYVQRKMAAERQFSIRRLGKDDSLDGCHLLFTRDTIGNTQVPDYTLTVLEQNTRADAGGMIELLRDDEHLDMHINNSLLEERGFRVSSRLISLAQQVQ